MVPVLLKYFEQGVKAKRRKWSGEEALESLRHMETPDGQPRFTYSRLPSLLGIKSIFGRGKSMLASQARRHRLAELGVEGGGQGRRTRRYEHSLQTAPPRPTWWLAAADLQHWRGQRSCSQRQVPRQATVRLPVLGRQHPLSWVRQSPSQLTPQPLQPPPNAGAQALPPQLPPGDGGQWQKRTKSANSCWQELLLPACEWKGALPLRLASVLGC